MLIWVPKLIYSKTGIKANSAASSGKQALGSVILLHIKERYRSLGKVFHCAPLLGERSVAERICPGCSDLISNTQQRPFILQARLSSLHTTRLHVSTKGSSSGHLKGSKEFQEDQDVKSNCHRKASRISSADSSCPETRTNSIQEFAESFEKQLHLKSKRSVSLVGNNQ